MLVFLHITIHDKKSTNHDAIFSSFLKTNKIRIRNWPMILIALKIPLGVTHAFLTSIGKAMHAGFRKTKTKGISSFGAAYIAHKSTLERAL